MMSSLHLDADDEPRSRALGATSRANSVRFDETANQNHFSSHSARPSLDLASRQSSGYSGLQMNERTPSHKSEGRASSVHSLRSAASGRASSLNTDYAAGECSPPLEATTLAPGLVLLGPQPAIIRCWLSRNFKHSSVRYAAVSTGSYRSWIDVRLIEEFGISQAIRNNEQGPRTMMIRLYFSEAVQSPASSSRSRSPITSQLPSLELEFCVVERSSATRESKAIQIVIGSDVLQPQRADIMFSTNKMTIFDNDGKKLSIPLVRPEDEATFSTLGEMSVALTNGPRDNPETESLPPYKEKEQGFLNGLGRSSSMISTPVATSGTESLTLASGGIGGGGTGTTGKYRPPGALAAEAGSSDATKQPAPSSSDGDARPLSRQSVTSRPLLSQINTRSDEAPANPGSQPTAVLPNGASGPWTSWRREVSSSTPSAAAGSTIPDWAGASKARETSYTRKETGIKVLKPKTANRTFSGTSGAPTTPAGASSPASESKSRFFDGKRRISDASERVKPTTKENSGLTAVKPSKANPIGGGSAFGWLDR